MGSMDVGRGNFADGTFWDTTSWWSMNAESDDINVIYKRNDGNYSLIEPGVLIV